MSDTPRTDAFEQLLDRPINWWDFARQLERENAALREDKERLEWVIKDSYYHFFFKLSSDLEKGRRQIDAARKEAQP